MTSVFDFLFRHIKIIGLIVVVGLMITSGVLYTFLQPEKVMERQQAKVTAAVERRSSKALLKLLAEDYRDQWKFDREQAAKALSEVGSQFIFLSVEEVSPTYDIQETEATVSMEMKLTGSGGPLAQEVMRRANKLKDPFTFYWRKNGPWPWSWEIVRIENPSLPVGLYGYDPGAGILP